MTKPLRFLITLGSGLAIATAVVLLFGRLPLLGEESVPAQDATLVNGGFEGTYEPWEGSDERKIAPGWSLWYHVEGGGYKEPKAGQDEGTRREGAKSQHMWHDTWTGYHGCLYQQVGGLTEGHYIRFSAWAKVNPHPELDAPDKWRTMVGIDPNGGTNPQDVNHYERPELWDIYTDRGQWQHLSVVMRATSPTATVYACAHPSLTRRLDVWWDDASFVMTEGSLIYAPIIAKGHFQVPAGTLANPDLEKVWGIYNDYHVPIPEFGNVKIAPYWLPYWNTNYITETSENKQPEYGPTGLGIGYAYRSHSGEWAQQMGSSGGGAFEAGIYQVVRGVRPGDTYSFTMWAHGWTQYWPSESDPADERVSDYQEPDGLQFKIGIDPYGGESYTSTHIIWSEKQDPYDEWYRFEVTATAMARQISVWAYANPTNYLLRWNETFWDDASLQIVESP